MAACDFSLKLGGTTTTLTGTASASDELRFVAACRIAYPTTTTDDDAVKAFLLDCRFNAKQLTKRIEQQAATAANVDTITEIAIT